MQLIARYRHLNESGTTNLNNAIIEETRHWLAPFPATLKLYEAALQKFPHEIYNRNVLDDLRLTLETFLHEILGNNKSLEHQIQHLGVFVKDKGGSAELVNMFNKLIEYYAKYQNTYVKHNSAVIEQEVEFVFEITLCFIRHLVRVYGAN